MVAVLLLVAAVFAFFQLSDRAANRDKSAAAECKDGPSTLFVTVDPELADPVRAAADRYNATNPKVRDHCAKVVVTAQPSAAIITGFTANTPWNGALGPQPGLWIADSMRSIESMRVPGLIEGTPVPVATTPIVLAVPDDLRQALEQAKVTWLDLPRLQQGSLDEVGLTGWGGLRMALPPGDATVAAAAAVGATVSGTDPLSDAAAQSGQVVAAISGLAAKAPQAADVTAALAGLDGAGSTIHAVAATEQQLKSLGGTSAFRPMGTAPVADHPAALMSGAWVDKTQNLIASIFVDYLRAPQQSQAFTAAGFTAAPAAAVSAPSRTALDKVRATLANPVLGVQATVLVDVSSSMGNTDGSATRISNVLGALSSTMNVMPPDFGLGVWTFAKNLDGTTPYKVQTPTAALSDQQRTALDTALPAVKATEARTDQAYPSLLAAYRAAVQGYTAGRTNSVLLITDGPDDDSTLTGAKLLSDLTAATDSARPVRIDIIVIGGNGTETLQTAAQRTGGTYTRLPTSDDISFGTAMVHALTTP
ncbi:substrate-binding and VWA domain-containing protein [Nocardia sp. NBC_00565]|uniref:VWA domain-containing protein n=1 Tax=Nocardia sp. NBC_00565 TaxID=2975993 RepID=UPI002E822168|nr:substrate-binding domain-containing protein [Nocardia sp. NBC_00565]WUC05268.1 substrate-binding and VWA domain-containing protein [Nocardia sp. NBC_00565]